MKEKDFPVITTLFVDQQDKDSLYLSAIRRNLKKLLPENFFEQKSQSERAQENLKKRFLGLLPAVKAIICEEAPGNAFFLCLSKCRTNGFDFFFNLIVNWLIPGKRLDVGMVYAIDFRMPEIDDETYTICEVGVHIDKKEELEKIIRDFPIIESDVRLGVSSAYYARRILEVKGLEPDQKTAMVQRHIALLVKRLPKFFDTDVFSEMQHVLVICHDDFKHQRDVRHLSRIISSHYLFRKELLTCIKSLSGKRQVSVKIFKAQVSFPAGQRTVLGVAVGLNFLRDKEVFEQRHLLKAIKHYIPNAEAIEETFFVNRRGSEQIITLYVEIEKNDGREFTVEEITNLKLRLRHDLKNHVARLTLPVFMPRNEEEIMRNILTLSNQIKYLRDIPQVSISFDEQTDRNLFFTIIIVKLAKEGHKSFQEIFKGGGTFLRYIHDRTKNVGYLRKKYPKEATVFRVKFPKDSFLRGDHSIDLYKARQAVVNELNRLFGEFRDFNGGMIAKQNELLTEVRSQLSKKGAKYNEILLENFFYSLAPVIMRTVLEPMAFKSLFEMLLDGLEVGVPFGHRYSMKMKAEPDFFFVMMVAHTRSILDDISKAINKLHSHNSELAQGYIKTPETVCMGYIYRCTDVHKQMQFQKTLESAAEMYASKAK
ncbi:Uncharacterized protein PHSC3_000219 [Chlamydiales bacterium STE3]|nr:Uncharacterized protein PHSC3_000219 [Chlamydiales bacterium STE3]